MATYILHFYNLHLSGRSVVTGFFPSPPRFLPSIFIAKRVRHSRNSPEVVFWHFRRQFCRVLRKCYQKVRILNPPGFELTTSVDQGKRLDPYTTGASTFYIYVTSEKMNFNILINKRIDVNFLPCMNVSNIPFTDTLTRSKQYAAYACL